MTPAALPLAASLAAAAGVPPHLLPAVAERCRRSLAALQAVAYARGGRVRVGWRVVAARVAEEAVGDWREGRLERVCAPQPVAET